MITTFYQNISTERDWLVKWWIIDTQEIKTSVIPYDQMNNIIKITNSIDCHMWVLEQTKEARFMPSLVQDRIQIGIIFNGNNKNIKSKT